MAKKTRTGGDNIPASRQSGRSEAYLLRIATEMDRLVELSKRTSEEKDFDFAERNVQQQERIEDREARAERDARLAPVKAMGSGILSSLPQLAGSLANPYKTKLEKTLDAASIAASIGGRAAGSIVGSQIGAAAGMASSPLTGGQAGLGALQGGKIGGDIGESLAQTAMALVRASNAMEVAANRGTMSAMDSMYGAGVEAGIFTPEEAMNMARDNMGAIRAAKLRKEKFTSMVAGEVGTEGNVQEFTNAVTSSVQQKMNDEKSNKDMFGGAFSQ